MTKKAIWISYDFGLKGDFTGLFTPYRTCKLFSISLIVVLKQYGFHF
jgi:hypothetical protein